MARKQARRLIVIGVGLAVLVLVVRFIWPEAPPTAQNRPIEAPTDGYVGSAACRSCHADQHAAWYGSYHRTMTQAASEESVLGDFNNVRLSGKDVDVRLFKEGGQFMAELNIQNPTTTGTFPVVLTTGSHNRQAYWLADPNSLELMILPYMFLRAEKRWIPRHAGYIGTTWQHAAPEKAIFTSERGRWAAICIKCHTTQGRPEPLNDAGAAAAPRVAEFGISCEACHGPGETHARTASAGMVNPARLAHDRSSQVCGQCHSVFFHRDQPSHEQWVRNGYSFRPGDDLFADPIRFISRGRADQMPDRPAHVPDPAGSGSFWSDGMIRVTGREFNGLIESPCYQRGQMSCLSCHQLHQPPGDVRAREEWAANQLRAGMDGNAACTSCHGQFKDAKLTQHTHHSADSSGSNCYNCHMPYTTYGILKAARSHQISSPSASASIATGRPNACNQCHQDKTLAWTADNLAAWYKQPKPKLSADEEQTAAMVLWALRGDAGQRAITAWSFGWAPALQASGNDWQAVYLAQLLDDPYDAVRFIAHRSLKRLPGFADFEYDFVGPPNARTAAAQMARGIWERAQIGAKRSFPRPTLIDPAGRVLDADFQRLLKLRDDRPLDIAE
jgi:hypothetical protein